MSDASDERVVIALTTAPSAEVAERIGHSLVEERLAACANVVAGITSIYRWRGSMEREDEVLVILKTTRRGVPALERRVVELHPYEVPEVIVLPVDAGHAPYLAWVRGEVGADGA